MKWPWNRPDPHPAELPSQEIASRVRALEERIAHLTADAGLLRVEWSEVLDKISHWASRQAGRDRKAASRSLEALSASEDAPGTTNPEHLISQHPPTSKAALRALVRARQRNGG